MILYESIFNNIIVETSEDKKKLYLKGVFMEAEQKNHNGRTYQKDQIAGAVNRINEAASQGRHILGELDHPSDSLEVKLSNVSHKITEMSMQGNNAIGKAEILEGTPNGQIAKGLIEAGITLGVSSRGNGSVNESTGIVEVYDFVTVDLVANPSAINAYPTSIRESIEMHKNGYRLIDLAEANIYDEKAQKYFQREIRNFIKSMMDK